MTTTARYRFRKARVVWTGLALLAVLAAFTGTVVTTGQEYARAAFSRALITFAVARTLNGVISVAQGTEVAVEPGGVGVNFSVGEVLDPINDLVERFSAVMLVATSSLGLQNVLPRMSTWWGTGLALAVAALFALAMLWWPGSAESGLKPVALKINAARTKCQPKSRALGNWATDRTQASGNSNVAWIAKRKARI